MDARDRPNEGGVIDDIVNLNEGSLLFVDTSSQESNSGDCCADKSSVQSDESNFNTMSCEDKARWENLLSFLYLKFRALGPWDRLPKVQNAIGNEEYNLELIDTQITGSPVFDDKRIAAVVHAFHAEKRKTKDIAKMMNISRFDVYSAILDYIWKSRSETLDGFSIVPLAGETSLDKACLKDLVKMLENSVLREEPCPSPSTIMKTFASGPEHLMVMIIALLAKMYDWPVAKDIEEHWDEIEEHPISTDDEYMESLTDFSKYSHEIFSDLCPPDLLDTSIESAVVCDTAAIDESVRYCESACAQLWKSVEILRNKVSQLLIEPDERIQCVDSEPNSSDEFQNQSCEETRRLYSEPRENSDGDDIHIVDVKTTDCYQMKANDPENLDEIPIGIMCLMRQIENSNFVRCQVVEKISSREYSAMLHDGREEIVDISRLARIRSIHLRCWEGVRVCALYEPKLDPHHQKAFYAGIVAVGPQHLSHDECLVFFDIGRDGFVAMRNVFVLAEQMYRKDSVAKTIDRVNNWQLVPKSRQRFIRYYLHQYPDWPLVPMKRKQNTQRVNVNRNGIPHSAFVLTTDRHLALLRFPRGSQLERNCVVIGCNRHVHDDEWIYRGSDRLQPIQAMILNLEKQRAALTGYGSNGSKFLSSRRSRRESRFVQSLEYSANKSRGLHTSLHANNGNQSWQPNDNSVYSVFSNDNDNDDEVCFIRQHAAYKALHSSQTIARSCSDSSLIRGSRKSRVFARDRLELQEVPQWDLPSHFHENCSPRCLQNMDKDPENPLFSGYSPYMIPLLSGWMRMIVRMTPSRRKRTQSTSTCKGSSYCQYKTPCGHLFTDVSAIAKYLKVTSSQLTVDLFTFDTKIRPNVIFRSPEAAMVLVDFTHGKEHTAIPVINTVDKKSSPEMIYDPRRYPYNQTTDISTIGPAFCTGCSCTDDCSDEEKCECRALTKREILRLEKSIQPAKARGYRYRNLGLYDGEWYHSGIYECNDNCPCNRKKCFNRVVQQDIMIPLELFKTTKKGWGIRTLVDLPKGVFICSYAGAILMDEQAEEIGQRIKDGDKYFADLNFVDDIEKVKEEVGVDHNFDAGFSEVDLDYLSCDAGLAPNESFIPAGNVAISEDDEGNSGDESYSDSAYEADLDDDDDNDETVLPMQGARETRQETDNAKDVDSLSPMEVAQPTEPELKFAETSIVVPAEDEDSYDGASSKSDTDNAKRNEGQCRFDILDYIEKNNRTTLYTIDARLRGNIGRFFNHSCDPNVSVNRVFVDTHDIRLPWIAFFTCKSVMAGTELCWDYGYQAGDVEGRKLMCYCGSRNCRGRLL